MAETNGAIELSVKLSPKDVKQSANAIRQEIESVFSKSSGKQSSAMTGLLNGLKQSYNQSVQLSRELDAIAEKQIPTAEYTEISNQIKSATAEFDKLLDKQEQFQREGKDSGPAWNDLQYKMEEASNTIHYAEGELQDLVEKGKAFTLGKDTEEFAKKEQALDKVNDKMTQQIIKYNEIRDKEAQSTADTKKQEKSQSRLVKALDKVKSAFNKVRKESKKASDETQKGAHKSSISFNKLFKKVLMYGFGIRSVYILVRKLKAAIKEGFETYANEDADFKEKLDNLKASAATLKNAFAAAFIPIANIVIPILQQIIDKIVALLGYFSQFTAAITGQKTYTKAVKQTASALKEATKAAKGYLSPIDTIHQMQEDTADDAQASTEPAFENVAVDPSMLNAIDKFKQKLGELRDVIVELATKSAKLFKKGFLEGFGDTDINDLIRIKDNLISIKNSLIEIFTDPEVVSSAKNLVSTLIENLGKLTGSAASIGVTLATNLTGGMKKYLDDNKDSIKSSLVNIMNAWADAINTVGDFAVAVADIFTVLRSENAQQITANILGIFTDIFTTILELGSNLGRDLISVILKPITENRETLKKSFQVIVDAITPITNAVKQLTSYIKGTALTLYTKSVKPMLDEVKNVLSAIVGFISKVIINEKVKALASVLNATLLPVLKTLAQSGVKVLATAFSTCANVITNFLKIVRGVITFLTGVFTGDWKKAWSGIKTAFSGVVGGIKSLWQGLFNTIKAKFSVPIEATKTALASLKSTISSKVDDMKSKWGTLKSTINSKFSVQKQDTANKLQDLKTTIDGKVDNIRASWNAKWNDMRDKVKAVWTDIKNGMKSPFNGIIAGVEAMVNAVIKGFNMMISAMNKLKFSVPNWVPEIGGESFGFNLKKISSVEIPRLAQGAVIPPNREFLAVLGDQKRGTNVEAPLETIKQAVRDVIGNTSSNQPMTINLVLDRHVVAQAVVEEGKLVRMTSGKNMFAI